MDRFRDANISTLSLVPALYRNNDPDGFVENFAAVLDDELLRWDAQLDELRNLKSPTYATEAQISYLYAEKGFEPPLMASLDRRRQVLFDLPSYILRKGDPRVVRDVIVALTGIGVDEVAFWSDDKYWVFGKSAFGLTTRINFFYKPRSQDAWIIGVPSFGNKKIGSDDVNRHLVYTVQLRLTRPPSSAERNAIEWACRYFLRAVDHCDIFFPSFASSFWTIGSSRIGINSKVKCDCWKFGASKFGVTSVICPIPVAPPSSSVVLPASPGTWVPWYGGGYYSFP